MLLPAAVRHLDELDEAGTSAAIGGAHDAGRASSWSAIRALEAANATTEGGRALEHATYMRDTVLAGDGGRARGGRPPRASVVADDLWPLPKYAEMLFVR